MSANPEALARDLAAGAPASPPWWRGRLAALDTETTGPEPMTARIVQAAIAYVGADKPIEKWSSLVNPGIDIPAEATAIHKVSNEMVRGAPHTADVVEVLLGHLARCARDGIPVVIMNAPFDLTVLREEALRCGISRPTLVGGFIDPKVLDKQADELVGHHRKGKRQLVDLCYHYDARIDGAHDATHDCIAAARVAYRIGQRFPTLGQMSLAELQVNQARWYRQQAEGLQEYWDRKGDPRKVDNYDWPIRPLGLVIGEDS
jgi:DNA polymerase-3 subunit epsilon